MSIKFQGKIPDIVDIYSALLGASISIYDLLKSGKGLEVSDSSNSSGDTQIGLDIIADEAFFDHLKTCRNVKYVVSEERPKMAQLSDGKYSIALDPIDGSKAALVGIPSGAIFGVYENVDSQSDFNGSKIISGGFFVFGLNLEVYFSDGGQFYHGRYDEKLSKWDIKPKDYRIPSKHVISINASNQYFWDNWFLTFLRPLLDSESSKDQSRYNMRWYGSMVSEIKRLIIEGGLFAYPADSRLGYENGHLRLVYEAIPMAYLGKAIGARSTNGDMDILDLVVSDIHQKTPVFIGNKELISQIEQSKAQVKFSKA